MPPYRALSTHIIICLVPTLLGVGFAAPVSQTLLEIAVLPGDARFDELHREASQGAVFGLQDLVRLAQVLISEAGPRAAAPPRTPQVGAGSTGRCRRTRPPAARPTLRVPRAPVFRSKSGRG